MSATNGSPFRNQLLKNLPRTDLDLLLPHVETVRLTRRKQLELPNRAVEHVYFPESGVASVVAISNADTQVEVGLLGHEGMTGLPIVLGNDRSPYSTYVQIEGDFNRVPAEVFRDALQKSPSFERICLNFVQAFLIQISQTAICNARANIEERLARWLLMAHDRMDGDEIPLTHEFLSLMMGARRPGVTEAVQALTRTGLILGKRGSVVLLDRKRLEERAGPYYGVPEKEYRRMLID